MSIDWETFAPEYIRSLPVYRPGMPVEELERELGIGNALKVASNENPMGPSPRALAAANTAAAEMHWYPDGTAYRLRQGLSKHLGVDMDEIVCGAGSNQIIHMLMTALCRSGMDEVVTHKYAFISYRLAAMSHNLPFVAAEVTSELGCDVDALIAAMSPRTKLVFLANPNNPTGAHLGTKAFERVLDAVPKHALLVVDEAYHEFGVYAASRGEADYPVSEHYRKSGKGPAILTLRTFSKIYGLSGLRVGYAVGDRRIIELINRVREPFNVSSVAQAAALAALGDEEHVAVSCETARASVAALRDAAARLGLRAYPSLGNFVLMEVGSEAEDVYNGLLRKGVIVRPMGPWGLPRCLRFSVAKPQDTQRIITALGDVLRDIRAR